MKLKAYLRGLGIGILVTAVIMGIALGKKGSMTDAEVKERAYELGMTEDKSGVLADDLSHSGTEADKPDVADTDSSAGIVKTPVSDNDVSVNDVVKADETDDEPMVKQPETAEPKAAETEPAETKAEEPKAEETKVEEKKAEEPKVEEKKEETKTEVKDPAESKKTDTKTDETKSEDTKTDNGSDKKITVKSGEGSYTVALKMKEAGIIINAEDFDSYLCKKGYDRKIGPGTYNMNSKMSYDELAKKLVVGE